MPTSKHILVTGGAGFIGSHLVDALIAGGHRVRILDALVPQVHPEGFPKYRNQAAEFIHGDVCDRQIVAKSLEGVDTVFHQAAEVGVGQSMYEIERYVKANAHGTAVLLQEIIAKRSQIQKLVVASSMSIYGEGEYECGLESDGEGSSVFPQLRSAEELKAGAWDPKCPHCGGAITPKGTIEDKPLFPTSIYAITKQDQEQYCLTVGRAYEIPTVALRYFNVYGTRQALSNPYTGACAIFSSRLLNDQPPIIFEDGKQARDFVHVSDIVQANLLAMDSQKADYQAINIGTGVATTIEDVAYLIRGGLDKKVKPEIPGQWREGDIRHCVADISLARELLDYEPRVLLGDGLMGLIEWVRKQNAVDMVNQAREELESRRLVH